MTYLITFCCYGSHLHGAPEGAVDRSHNRYGSPFAKANPGLFAAEQRLMNQDPYELNACKRQVVLEGMVDRCVRNGWDLVAAHVRTNHVHIIVEAEEAAEFVMTQLKCAASRRLNELGFDCPTRKRWARHGSTRRIIGRENVRLAILYVLEGQGEPMAIFPRTA